MSNKSSFTAEEWDALRQTPLLAAMVVIAASPSGPVGMFQESAAASRVLLDEIKSSQTELLLALAEDMKASLTVPRPSAQGTADLRTAGLDACRHVVGILRQKATADELAEYRTWVNTLARRVAEAAKEGGFLGFGGTPVSGEETTALADIATALS